MIAVALLLAGSKSDIADIDKLARDRDYKGLAEYCTPILKLGEPFWFVMRSGPFGGGRSGWKATMLKDPGGDTEYVVFGTKITTQGFGAVVYEFSNGKMTRLVDEADDRGYMVSHYGFDMRFDPEEKKAMIEATVSLSRMMSASGTLSSKRHAHFRLSPHYIVSKITDVSGKPVPFTQTQGVVSVEVPQGPNAVLKMTYEGVVDNPRFAGAITNDEVMLTNDYWWPMIARQPAKLDVTAHVPQDWTVVTHGNKTYDTVEGPERTVKYKMEVPISYLSFSAGKFGHVSKQTGRINYHVWSKDMSREDMLLQLELMPPVIEFYEQFAPYPFDDFGAMVTQLYGGGALEAYSYATYGTGWLPDIDSHEPAHTWWGGIVPNTYMRSFWNESFTVFSSGLFAREQDFGNREERRKAFVQQFPMTMAYEQVPLVDSGAFKGGVASAMGYGMGAAVLQQLEREIGTEMMIKAMKAWAGEFPNGSSAEWESFEASLSRTTGRDMSWFFDQWVRTKGAPSFQIKSASWDNGEVVGLVDFRGNPYRLTAEVYAELRDGSVVSADVVLNPDRETAVSEFRFKLSSRPKFLSFDPYERILMSRPDNTGQRLTSTLFNLKPVVDAKHTEYQNTFRRFFRQRQLTEDVPSSAAGHFFIGHPDTMPIMKALCERAGFKVVGDSLTYDGTTIDLNKGAAMAIVNLGSGRTAAIALGNTRLTPDVGISSLCLLDDYGRFLRGKTEPIRTGSMTFTMR